ncbi:MAG: hypothetical protein EOP50_18080, partial [Sphingobacteriales bacterium]
VPGNRRQLQQLFQNLIGNALKYNKPGVAPEISISARPASTIEVAEHVPGALAERAYQLIEVRDNGIGFEPGHAEQIFKIFQRLHGHAEYSGTGVGLAIVRKIVENHGGAIWANSQPGEGAHFYLLLPSDRI